MNYLFEAILFVFVLTCLVTFETFRSSLYGGKDLSQSIYKSITTGIGFIIYAGIDYLMIVPGANYVMS